MLGVNLASAAASSTGVLVVIPARLGSARLARKPLRLLGGTPLVLRVWERVQAIGVAARCIVATDSDEIAEVVTRAGAEVRMTRADHPSGTDRVAEVIEAPDLASYRTILNVQGDEPFVSSAAVLGAAAMVAEGRFPLGTAAAPCTSEALATPSVVKVVHADDGRALYFSRAPIPWMRDPADARERNLVARQHIGVYAYDRDALRRWVALPAHPLERIEKLEQLRPLAAGMAMGVCLIDEPPEAGIDTEQDLAAANVRWETRTAAMS